MLDEAAACGVGWEEGFVNPERSRGWGKWPCPRGGQDGVTVPLLTPRVGRGSSLAAGPGGVAPTSVVARRTLGSPRALVAGAREGGSGGRRRAGARARGRPPAAGAFRWARRGVGHSFVRRRPDCRGSWSSAASVGVRLGGTPCLLGRRGAGPPGGRGPDAPVSLARAGVRDFFWSPVLAATVPALTSAFPWCRAAAAARPSGCRSGSAARGPAGRAWSVATRLGARAVSPRGRGGPRGSGAGGPGAVPRCRVGRRVGAVLGARGDSQGGVCAPFG